MSVNKLVKLIYTSCLFHPCGTRILHILKESFRLGSANQLLAASAYEYRFKAIIILCNKVHVNMHEDPTCAGFRGAFQTRTLCPDPSVLGGILDLHGDVLGLSHCEMNGATKSNADLF